MNLKKNKRQKIKYPKYSQIDNNTDYYNDLKNQLITFQRYQYNNSKTYKKIIKISKKDLFLSEKKMSNFNPLCLKQCIKRTNYYPFNYGKIQKNSIPIIDIKEQYKKFSKLKKFRFYSENIKKRNFKYRKNHQNLFSTRFIIKTKFEKIYKVFNNSLNKLSEDRRYCNISVFETLKSKINNSFFEKYSLSSLWENPCFVPNQVQQRKKINAIFYNKKEKFTRLKYQSRNYKNLRNKSRAINSNKNKFLKSKIINNKQ